MVWNAQNLLPLASGNHAAYSAPNHAAYSAFNHAAYSAPNHAAYSAPNHAAYSAPNHAAYSAPNHAAYPSGAGPAWVRPAPGTGAGGARGAGFQGGYGPVARSEYATPAAWGPLPWTLDFAVGNGWPAVPSEQRINPHAVRPPLQWHVGDWDPGLRFWTLPFDDQLNEWLQDLNLGSPAVMAARELAGRHHNASWLAVEPGQQLAGSLQALLEDDPQITGWRAGAVHAGRTVTPAQAWNEINRELSVLVDQMRDDRLRYLPELAMQSAHITPYYVHLMGIDPASKPWTMELMNCATAIGNLVKMQYKAMYRRVRPSLLCPGLTPPWGPPQHPAFPSGHSMVAHLMALFLLSVPGIAQRFGIFRDGQALGDTPRPGPDFLDPGAIRYGQDQRSPLLWLAWRVARGRERLGVHYPSDSAASRKLAAGVWARCRPGDAGEAPLLQVPSLQRIWALVEAEWPTLQPNDAVLAPAAAPAMPHQARG